MNSVQTGARIAALRKEQGMTQRELAQLVGVSDKAVSKWERGECFPDITIFPRLAELFGVPVEELMGERQQEVCLPPQESGAARLLRDAFFRRQLMGNLLLLTLCALGIVIGGLLSATLSMLCVEVCLLLIVSSFLLISARQRQEANYLREKYGAAFVGEAPRRYTVWLACWGLLLLVLFFLSTMLDLRWISSFPRGFAPHEVLGKSMLSFLRMPTGMGRLIPLTLLGCNLALAYSLSERLAGEGPVQLESNAASFFLWVTAPSLLALLLLAVFGSRELVLGWEGPAERHIRLFALCAGAGIVLLGSLLLAIRRRKGAVLPRWTPLFVFAQGVAVALCGLCFVRITNEQTNVFGIVYTQWLFVAALSMVTLCHAAVWLTLCRPEETGSVINTGDE